MVSSKPVEVQDAEWPDIGSLKLLIRVCLSLRMIVQTLDSLGRCSSVPLVRGTKQYFFASGTVHTVDSAVICREASEREAREVAHDQTRRSFEEPNLEYNDHWQDQNQDAGRCTRDCHNPTSTPSNRTTCPIRILARVAPLVSCDPMESKRPLPPLTRSNCEHQEDERALLLLLSSASAQAPLPLVPTLVQPPPLPALPFTMIPAPPPMVRPAARQRRILPRPSPLELSASPVCPDAAAAAVGDEVAGTPPPSAASTPPPPRDSPPPRLPVSRSTSGVSTHSTASSCLSMAEMVAELAVARSRSDDDAASAPSKNLVASPTTLDARPRPPNKPVKKKRIRLKTERRREQCRANQARYRNKQRDHAVVLAERVEQLRAEVQLLEQQSREHLGGSEAVMWVVTEYFRLFRHGLAAEASSSAGRTPTSRQQQLAFLESSMAPELRLGWDVCGVGALVEQWRRYSQYHDDPVLELLGARQVENVALNSSVGSMVHATASLSVTFTRETIVHVFPHLSSGTTAAATRIAKTLVGARVTYPWSVVFEFDEHCAVQRLTSSADFVAPLMSVLRSAEDVSVVLEGALVQHAWHLGDSA